MAMSFPHRPFKPVSIFRLQSDCRRALELVAKIETENKRLGRENPPLDAELSYTRSWSLYGLYFAEKIRGGVALAEFRRHGDPADQERAVEILTRAASFWEQLAESIAIYNHEVIPDVYDDEFSWKKFIPEVYKDIEIARQAEGP